MIDPTVKASLVESGITFLDWLNAPYLPEDLLPLPWNQSILYMPIEVVRNKIAIMREHFEANVSQIDVSANAINTQTKDTCFWATVKFIIKHKELPGGEMIICGTASFLMGQYNGWAFTQIAESLATVRAFSKEWAQFGKDLNKEIDSIKDLKSPTGSKKNNAISKTLSQ